MLFPDFSKIIYKPVRYIPLFETTKLDSQKYTDTIIQKRNMIHFKLYEIELDLLFNYIKAKNSYLLALTYPLNLDTSPQKSCLGTLDQLSAKKYQKTLSLYKNKDFKSAYAQSLKLIQLSNSNATVLHLHGKIAKSLGKITEAKKYLELAIAFDCENWRSSPVYNAIIEKVALNNDVTVFNFHQLLKSDWPYNSTFIDEYYPQNFYFEKLSIILAKQLKEKLKL
jgi:tetratricopeptide (TPR) repeat protein